MGRLTLEGVWEERVAPFSVGVVVERDHDPDIRPVARNHARRIDMDTVREVGPDGGMLEDVYA